MPSKDDLQNPGYTPSRKDLGAVFEWLFDADPNTAKLAERSLVSAGTGVIAEASDRLTRSSPTERVALVRLLGRLAQLTHAATASNALLGALADPEARVVRTAVVALGKLPSDDPAIPAAEAALLEHFPRFLDAERRAAIESLGKIGSARAHSVLASVVPTGPVETQLLARAVLRLGRSAESTDDADNVRLDVALGEPIDVALFHRRGLSEIVNEQLIGRLASSAESSEQRLVKNYAGPLATLFESRSILTPALVLPLVPPGAVRPEVDADWAELVAKALCQQSVQSMLERLTTTRPRLRLSVPAEGHQRALLWRISELLAKATERITVNPKAALWEVEIDRGRRPRLYLIPKRFDDPRFQYRVKDISGASHPTIAAALADVAAPGAEDVVWDPFVGSGLELVECGLKGAYRELIGTDNDARSLEAAAANVQAAGLDRVRLLNADARTAQLPYVSVIVTNPPLGIRHRRDGMLLQLLLEFLNNARRLLAPNGRLVWLSPLPQQTADYAQRVGFLVQRCGVIDVGGLSPELQVMEVPEHRGQAWHS